MMRKPSIRLLVFVVQTSLVLHSASCNSSRGLRHCHFGSYCSEDYGGGDLSCSSLSSSNLVSSGPCPRDNVIATCDIPSWEEKTYYYKSYGLAEARDNCAFRNGSFRDSTPVKPPADMGQLDLLQPDQLQSCKYADMVVINGKFCMDIHEASRQDATSTDVGLDQTVASNKEGVLPWIVQARNEADKACANAGKRLCTAQEWIEACQGPKSSTYPYGIQFNQDTCNVLDPKSTATRVLSPTGKFSGCKSAWGIYDMAGNAAEYVLGGMANNTRGGSYKSADPKTHSRCSLVNRSWDTQENGFRCCHSP